MVLVEELRASEGTLLVIINFHLLINLLAVLLQGLLTLRHRVYIVEGTLMIDFDDLALGILVVALQIE